MNIAGPRYDKVEFARRGDEAYERIREKVEATDRERYLAIDVDSDEYEIADDVLTACDRLQERRPESQTWIVRIGHRAVYKIRRLGGTSTQ